MANLYSKVHRLKAQGWTWDHFLLELSLIHPSGIDEKTLKGLYRQPHRKPTRHVSQLIETLHQQCFPSPFPADCEALMAIYNRLLQCKKHPSLERDRKDLILFVKANCEAQPPLKQARLYWLLGNLFLDQLAQLRVNGQHQQLAEAKQQGINYYQLSLGLLETQQASIDSLTRYKLHQNLLACHLNALEPDQRFRQQPLLALLQETRFQQASKNVLQDEPYQWVVARNGLRFASLSQNAGQCEFFFNALTTASEYFRDLDYHPYQAPALSQSKEFSWAIDQVIFAQQDIS